MQIHNKMEKVGRNSEPPSINQWKSVICVGRAKRSCQNEKNETIANGKVARCYLKYVISSDFRIGHTEWLKCIQENQYSVGNFHASKCCAQF